MNLNALKILEIKQNRAPKHSKKAFPETEKALLLNIFERLEFCNFFHQSRFQVCSFVFVNNTTFR